MSNIAITGPREIPLGTHYIIDEVLFNRYTWGTTIINGACIGVDAYVARIAYRNPALRVHTVVPAVRGRYLHAAWQRYCHTFEEMPAGTTLLDRNQRMVDLANALIGFPRTLTEEQRSGTWSTIRRARKKGIVIHLYALDGNYSGENLPF